MKDPEFLAEADKLKIEVDPLTGEQVAATDRRDLRRRRPTVVARARRHGAESKRQRASGF